jgi:hypothetical protein
VSTKKQETKVRNSKRLKLNAVQFRTVWILIAVFLIFIGPTYIVYLIHDILGINYLVSMFLGFILFCLGLILLVKNKKPQYINSS